METVLSLFAGCGVEQMVASRRLVRYNQEKLKAAAGSVGSTSPNLTPSAHGRRLEAMPDSTSRPDFGPNTPAVLSLMGEQ